MADTTSMALEQLLRKAHVSDDVDFLRESGHTRPSDDTAFPPAPRNPLIDGSYLLWDDRRRERVSPLSTVACLAEPARRERSVIAGPSGG